MNNVTTFSRTGPSGQKLIASDTVSRLNDRYYGQWLMMNVAFRDSSVFMTAEIKQKVLERFQYTAMALHWAPEYWSDARRIQENMQLEAMVMPTLRPSRARWRHRDTR